MQLKTAENTEKIYLDSNVLFSYFTKGVYDNNYEKTNALIESIIKSTDKIAVISQLVILEMWNIFRNRVIQREKYRGDTRTHKEIIAELRDKIQGLTMEFTDKITEWEGSKKLRIIPINKSVTDFLTDVGTIHINHFGFINDVCKCSICKNEKYRGYKYKGVDHWDIQHALIAKDAKVNRLVTFDKGYNVLKRKGVLGKDLQVEILTQGDSNKYKTQ